jgi:hypothetical protein
MRRALLLVLIATHHATAQATWVVVEQRATLDGGHTADDVKRDALYGALGEAVRRVAGVQVQSGELATRGDSAGRLVDRYVQSVRLDASGRAIEWHIVHEEWTIAPKSTAPPSYHLTLRVLVARDVGSADPSFTAQLGVSRATLQVRGEAPAANDELIASVIATQNGFATLVTIVGDSVFVLAPNVVAKEIPVAADTTVEIPAAADRDAGLHFRATLPAGTPARAELLATVVTRTRIRLPSGATSPRGALSLAEFNRWLSGIPLDQRAIAQTALAIQRTR